MDGVLNDGNGAGVLYVGRVVNGGNGAGVLVAPALCVKLSLFPGVIGYSFGAPDPPGRLLVESIADNVIAPVTGAAIAAVPATIPTKGIGILLECNKS